MREIIFRAKQLDNGEWVEGWLFDDGMVDSTRRFIGDIIITDYKGNADDKWEILGTNFYEVLPDTICQFTGLHDKHGNKIWENDIVRCYKYISGYDFVWNEKVQYKNGHFRSKSVANLGFCSERQNTLVIGNIFDNPELLKEV